MTASNTVGFLLTGHDNRATFFECEPPSGVLCPTCRSVIDQGYRPARLSLRTGMDVSTTYDNVMVVSTRFVGICLENQLPGIAFHAFEGSNRSYHFVEASRVVEYDPHRSPLRSVGSCRECGQPESTVGLLPAYSSVSGTLARGFHRTVGAYGSGTGKRPVLIVDPGTANLFKSARLVGMGLIPIEGAAPAS
jgi:hypothetical protein